MFSQPYTSLQCGQRERGLKVTYYKQLCQRLFLKKLFSDKHQKQRTGNKIKIIHLNKLFKWIKATASWNAAYCHQSALKLELNDHYI